VAPTATRTASSRPRVARAAEHEARDVAARDQQDETDRAEDETQRSAQVVDHHLLIRHQRQLGALGHLVDEFGPKRGRQQRCGRASLLERRTGLEPPDQRQVLAAADRLAHLANRGIRADGIDRAEARRHHADDGVRSAVHRDRAPDDSPVAREPPLPQRMAQDHDARAAGLVPSSVKSRPISGLTPNARK